MFLVMNYQLKRVQR